MLIDKLRKNGYSLLKVRSIYVFTTVFLVGLSVYTFIQVLHLFDAFSLIRHTSQVSESLNKISIAILDAESNKRGYLLTGDSNLLTKRDLALESLKQEYNLLTQLLVDNPVQNRNLAILDTTIRKKLESINYIWIDEVVLPIIPSLQANEEDGVGKMDSVRHYLGRMTLAENQLYTIRSRAFSRLSIVTPVYIIVLFLGALLILFYSYFRINSELKESQNLYLAFKGQSQSKLVLGDELMLANQELAFQNREKEDRASELTIANTELAFQSEEKEKRAAELVIANLELGFQNEIKEKLAAELIIANHELAFQNEEKEKRSIELFNANKELQLFLNISSHDLQEPLRKIQISASRIDDADFNALSPKGQEHFVKMQEAAQSMQVLIEDLLMYSRASTEERIFEYIDLNIIINQITDELKVSIDEKQAIIEITDHCEANIIPFQFRQLVSNMLSNALKFSIPGKPPHIKISSCIKKGSDCKDVKLVPDQEYCHITVKDNGIGFEPKYNDKIFEVFQRLYGKDVYKGTGIGLAIVKKIVENHSGIITARGQLNQGANFDIYIPTKTKTKNG